MEIVVNQEIVEVVIIRKKIKNIYFRFKPDLKLYISCGLYVSDNQIRQLIAKNGEAIAKMHSQVKKKTKANNKVYILGDEYSIIIDDQVKKPFINNNYIFAASLEDVDKFYLKEAKKFMDVRFERCYNLFSDLPPTRLRYRKMTSRWGVCNTSTKFITLNTELYRFNVTLIDYVIIHELCHYKEANHSEAFWNEVKKYYPNYKQARKLLKEGV